MKSLWIALLMAFKGDTASSSNESDDDSLENTTSRIIGGQGVDISDFPYQVSIAKNGIHRCGGSIISQYFILTAAHCIIGDDALQFTVRVGTTSWNQGGFVLDIDKIYVYPKFDYEAHKNDIGIIDLKSRIPFSDSIAPVRLAEANEPLPRPGSWGTITGWGKHHSADRNYSPLLKMADVQVISWKSCQKSYPNFPIDERVICAGIPEGGRDGCSGDSGGPFAISGIQYGISSWGKGCGERGFPGVYTSIPKFRGWIYRTTGY